MSSKKEFWTGIGVMIGTAFLICLLTFLVSGCELAGVDKDTIKEQIIVYVQNRAIESANDYIDDMVEQGNLSEEQAEELKSAIPQGAEKIREALK